MTSHIYLAAGMWDDVVAANEQATSVGATRARAAGRTPPGCGHPNMWLMYGYLQQGRTDAARKVLDACRVSATGGGGLALRAPEQDPLDPDNIPAGSYIQMWSRYLIDTGEWNSDLAKEDLPLGSLAGAAITRAFVRALRAADGSDPAGLRRALEAVQKAREGLDAVLAARRDGADQYRRRAEILEQEIHALVALAEGKNDNAVTLLERAASMEDAMPAEFGPPFVDKPARELLGDVLLRIGRRHEAAAAYEAALRRTPGRRQAGPKS
jgi:tetratricopeptide (TPR) repeat protein